MRAVAARDGVGLAVHSRGAGPDLLCVPGGPGRASVYLEDLGGLDATRSLLLLDNRGTGQSELPGDRSSLEFPRLADDVEDTCVALGLEPADVLAHSAGCPVALVHAARYPGRVRALILVTPSGRAFGWAPDDVEAIRRARAGEPWFAEANEAADAMEHASRGGRGMATLRSALERETRPFWYGRWDERAQAHAAGADEQMSLRANAGFAPGPDWDVAAAREALRSIGAAVLVVVAERDALTGVSVGRQLAETLPHASVAVIEGAGHFPWVDQPEQFRAVVEAFLAR